MFCKLLPTLSTNTLVLTVNRRLSHHLIKSYDAFQRSMGKISWSTLNAIPLQTWLQACWEKQTVYSQHCLSQNQSRALWLELITNDRELSALIQASAAAQLAQQAWDTLHLWNIGLDHPALQYSHNPEVEIFLRWANEFQRWCYEHDVICESELAQRLNRLIENDTNAITLPKEIVLIGFDELNPSTETLLSTLANTVSVRHWEAEKRNATVVRTELIDIETEILAMARWARNHWNQHPELSIGCIVPSLSELRPIIARIFHECFDDTEAAYNISASQSLKQYLMIRQALTFLQWVNDEIDPDSLSMILQSPYFNISHEDPHYAALVDAHWREYNELTLQPKHLLTAWTRLETSFPNSTWLKRWQAFIAISRNRPSRASTNQWAEFFTQTLQAIGWPGGRTLDSLEYQLMQRWQALLDEFTLLETVHSEISLSQALTLLNRLAQQSEFQPESPDTPIQVLGALEAGAMQFDRLWVMGLHDGIWPPAPQPNPFLPLALQRKYNMPHASAERELEYTQHQMQRLLNSADDVVLSSPQRDGEQGLQPSKLIASFPLTILEALSLDLRSPLTEFIATAATETLEESLAPQVRDDERITGGSWILKQQSACPFRAFAAVRLKAQDLSQPDLGLAPSLRGALVHAALEYLWNTLKNSETLHAQDEEQLDRLIHEATSAAIREQMPYALSNSTRYFLKLDRERIEILIRDWLALEKNRPGFRVVEMETDRHIQVGKLSLDLRIDRIDELNNGDCVIIDYKTGISSIHNWFSARPVDPQLPLYCSFDTDHTNYHGITFAELRPGQHRLRGVWNKSIVNTMNEFDDIVSIDELDTEDMIDNWHDLKNHWQKTLTQLSDDFYNGIAVIDPRDATICNTCDLHALCRISHE